MSFAFVLAGIEFRLKVIWTKCKDSQIRIVMTMNAIQKRNLLRFLLASRFKLSASLSIIIPATMAASDKKGLWLKKIFQYNIFIVQKQSVVLKKVFTGISENI